jgi:hypothetical protein
VKFVRVLWVGPDVKAMEKGRVGMLRPDFEAILQGCHVDLQATDIADLEQSTIEVRLLAATGAHKPNNFDFCPGPDSSIQEDSPSPTKSTPSPVSAEPVVVAASTSGEGCAPSEMFDRIRDNNDAVNWMLLKLDGDNSIQVACFGTEGLAQLLKELANDKVFFGVFRVHAVDVRGDVKSVRAKFIRLCWMGPDVKAIDKGKIGNQRAEFEQILHACHIDIQASELSELATAVLEHKILAGGGAHKPNHFDFAPCPMDVEEA